uniref:Uncharacterized protein n=1 Tax=Romanomermis culicivorax TaxID=13658 RepID=A0A915KDM7_ROMCU
MHIHTTKKKGHLRGNGEVKFSDNRISYTITSGKLYGNLYCRNPGRFLESVKNCINHKTQ